MIRPPERVVTHEVVEAAPAQALAALFDDGLPIPQRGDALPALWHWVSLTAWPGAHLTGSDGHPIRGDVMPDLKQGRRMWAGGRVDFHAPLIVGSTIQREVSVRSVVEKVGTSGGFTLLVVEQRIINPNGDLAVVEQQDIVFREPPTVGGEPSSEQPALAARLISRRSPWAWSFETDPTKLMRFSAATANGHRIHYDWPYATSVEGYPGLVVHGPLMTLTMLQVSRHEVPGATVRSLSHRNRRPLFCGQVALVRGTLDGDCTVALSLDALGTLPEGHSPNATVDVVLDIDSQTPESSSEGASTRADSTQEEP